MTRIGDINRVLAAVLVTVVFAGLLIPLCTMPSCADTATAACGDFAPACDKCPDPIVMKHAPNDALPSATAATVELAVATHIVPSAALAPVALVAAPPAVTASPPPRDPLGVRLTV